MTYDEFALAIVDAIAAEPPSLPPAEAPADVRLLFFKLGCISDVIVRSGLAEIGQRDLLQLAAERCWTLASDAGARTDPDTLALCSEIIGYLSTVEGCRLPVALPSDLTAFAAQLRLTVVGLASRAAFALSTRRGVAHLGRRFLREAS